MLLGSIIFLDTTRRIPKMAIVRRKYKTNCLKKLMPQRVKINFVILPTKIKFTFDIFYVYPKPQWSMQHFYVLCDPSPFTQNAFYLQLGQVGNTGAHFKFIYRMRRRLLCVRVTYFLRVY